MIFTILLPLNRHYGTWNICFIFFVQFLTICLGWSNALDTHAASLYVVIKDHNCKSAIDLITTGQQKTVRDAAERCGFQIENVEVLETGIFTSKPCHVTLTNNIDVTTAENVIDGLENIKPFLDFTLTNLYSQGKRFVQQHGKSTFISEISISKVLKQSRKKEKVNFKNLFLFPNLLSILIYLICIPT